MTGYKSQLYYQKDTEIYNAFLNIIRIYFYAKTVKVKYDAQFNDIMIL